MKNNKRKILYIGVPFHSHVNPIIGIIKALVDNGHHVLFQGIGKLSSELESLGAKNTGVEYCFNPEPQTVTHPFKALSALFGANATLLPIINEIIQREKPDCIMHDHFCLWGKIVALQNNIPAVSLITTLVLDPAVLLKYSHTLPIGMHLGLSDLLEVPTIASRFLTLKQKSGLRHFKITDILTNPESLNLVFTSKLFQPLGEIFDARYKFIGPSIYPRSTSNASSWRKDHKRKTLYLCFGTMHGTLDLYKKCLDILKHTPYQIIVSLGNRIPMTNLGPFPKNVRVYNFVPQLDVLKNVDAFISHGGMNSVSESLYSNVPLVMIPILNEQVMNASRVQELGAGIMIRQHHFRPTNLIRAIEHVVTDKSFKKNTRRIQNSFFEAGGYKRGAQEIENYCL